MVEMTLKLTGLGCSNYWADGCEYKPEPEPEPSTLALTLTPTPKPQF